MIKLNKYTLKIIKNNDNLTSKQNIKYLKNNISFLVYFNNDKFALFFIKITNKNAFISYEFTNNKYYNIYHFSYILKLICNYLFNKNIENIYILSKFNCLEKIGFNKILHSENIFYRGKALTKISYILNKNDFYFMNKYDTILFDIDDTILSFHKAEKYALTKALAKVNIKANDKIIKHYHKINMSYWEKVEKKLITREQCVVDRFKEFLPLYNVSYDPNKFEDLYRYYLNKQAFIIKDARKVLTKLSKTHRIYAITNGVKLTQQLRMKKANMNKYFIKSFISEVIGFDKPSFEFFDYVKNNIENFNANKTIIIGDSLTSDIKLGNNNNIDTCWFNLHKIQNTKNITPKYVIYYLDELILK